MENVDRLWRDMWRLTPSSPLDDVTRLAQECLTMNLPWPSRLTGIAGLLHQAIGGAAGVSVYGVVKPGESLVLLSGAGYAGPLAVPWGAPLAGLAAQEKAAQFAGEARAFPDYLGGWLGVQACVAVPIMQERQLFAVLEVRSHEEDRLGLPQAELTGAVAAVLAQAWQHASQSTETKGGSG